MALEPVLEKVQKQTRDIYRSLAKIWNYLEELNNSRDASLKADIEMLLTYMQQTVSGYLSIVWCIKHVLAF